MKKFQNSIIGILLIIVGTILGLNAFHITHINLFFEGWWTLFIIIPSLCGIFTERDKTASLIGLFIGVYLLLSCPLETIFTTCSYNSWYSNTF